ncbi:MAG: gliding motility-associated C-terminal domain-containing protein [Bacteroidales bacterium]|jgi:gliding motility-associated-like protein|nr:gliding motility-associated C-terminal domain-containing protein [Bacteroidales bacterium]
MDNSFDKNIQELLQSFTEQPSVDCWNKIETQLDTLQTTNANSNSGSSSSSSPPPSGNGSVFSQLAGTVTGKIVSVIVATTVIGGIVSLVVVNSMDTDTVEQSEAKIIKEDPQTNPSTDENNVWTTTETDTFHIKPTTETKEITNMPVCCFDEQRDTTSYEENKNILPAHTTHASSEVSTSHTTMENTTKQETTPKTEHKSQSIVKPPAKEVSETQNTPPESSPGKEDTQENPEQPNIRIPNIFTPNGDYFDDYFVIGGIEQFSETHLFIFRQDGKIIYDKINYQNDWNGDNIQDGVYFYVFKFMYQGSQFMRRGSITIKR